MAAALPARLQAPPHGRVLAPWRSDSGAWPVKGGGSRDRRRLAPSLPPPPASAAAARPAVVCCSAGSASQPAVPQPEKQPRKPFSWTGILRSLAVALLSPILFPLYILLVDPLDPEEAPTPAKKPWLPGSLAYTVFHMVALAALPAGVEALGPFTAPAWAEAAANTLLGHGRVGQVLTACSMLSVPRSPTMQLCTILAIYVYYRCIYHFEAWHAARYPERPSKHREDEALSSRLARQGADRITRRLFGPRAKAIFWVLFFVGGPGKWLDTWLRNGLARYGIFLV